MQVICGPHLEEHYLAVESILCHCKKQMSHTLGALFLVFLIFSIDFYVCPSDNITVTIK